MSASYSKRHGDREERTLKTLKKKKKKKLFINLMDQDWGGVLKFKFPWLLTSEMTLSFCLFLEVLVMILVGSAWPLIIRTAL